MTSTSVRACEQISRPRGRLIALLLSWLAAIGEGSKAVVTPQPRI